MSSTTPESSMQNHLEIERRWIVPDLPEYPDNGNGHSDYPFPHEWISQAYEYIEPDGSNRRVRRVVDAHNNISYFRTTKRQRCEAESASQEMDEEEVPITEDEFQAVWGSIGQPRFEKIRLYIPYGETQLSLDVYGGPLHGYIFLEVEFTSSEEAEQFQPPLWCGAEVTHDPRYTLKAIAAQCVGCSVDRRADYP